MARARQGCHTRTEKEVAHSRLGRPRIQASNRALHQQVPPPPASGTAVKGGCPGPAGGSRGSRPPPRTPWLPRPHSQGSPAAWALTPYCPSGQNSQARWAGCRRGTSGFRAPDLPPLLSYSSAPSTRLHKWEGVVSAALGQPCWPVSTAKFCFTRSDPTVRLVFELGVTQRSRRGAPPPGLCGQPLQDAI